MRDQLSLFVMDVITRVSSLKAYRNDGPLPYSIYANHCFAHAQLRILYGNNLSNDF